MDFGILETAEVIERMENYIAKIRPDEEIRDQVDISYKIEGHSIVIFEIRPRMMPPYEKFESPVAKTTFMKAKNQWKIYWMRSNQKWFPYKTEAVDTLDEFLQIVQEDRFGCFWG